MSGWSWKLGRVGGIEISMQATFLLVLVWVARPFGVRPREIRLLPIGGVGRMERMPETPKAEMLIAWRRDGANAVEAA
jgi:hypothetical protein